MSKKSDLSALQLLEDISGNLNKLVELIPEDVNEKQIDCKFFFFLFFFYII